MEDLDSRLLNSDQENNAARELREKKRGNGDGEADAGVEENGEPLSFRQRVMQARQELNLKEKAKERLKEKVLSPIKQGSRSALKKAWMSFGTVIGAIIGYLYIHLHILLKWVFGEKLFCKLGDEWIPPKVAQVGGEQTEIASKSFGLIEIMILLFIDTIVFFIIVCLVALFTNESTFKNMAGEANKTNQPAAVQQTK